MNLLLLTASLISFITFLIHLFVGGSDIVEPLLEASDLQEIPKLTTYYCWHMVTLLLLTMSGAYAYTALVQPSIPLTVAMTILAAACGGLSVAMVVIRKLKPFAYPQWLLLLSISLFGTLGIVV